MATLDGLHPVLMRPRVEAMFADPEAKELGIYLVSGFRSVEHQRRLFEAAVRQYGSERAARKWVAPPGRSNHGPRVDGFGTAVDLGVPGVRAVSGQWPEKTRERVDKLAARYGLYSPMDWEDWHYEPITGWKEDELSAADVAELKQFIQSTIALQMEKLRGLDEDRAKEWAVKTVMVLGNLSKAQALEKLNAIK